MKKILILLIFLSVYVYGCATTGNNGTVQDAGNTETVQNNCVPNFTEGGSFWEGRTYQSFKVFSNLSKGQAFDKALVAISANGLQISSSNKEAGLISASTAIAFGKGNRAPFNVLITDIGKKTIRVEISYNIGPGSVAATPAIIEAFCKFYNAISPYASNTNENSSAKNLKVKKKYKKHKK
ncbi:MAG: hypothetical protein CVU51_07705 [Deltaproteobacteria bacterium HGW-Deltaproteobacteria-1]|jgi:hypothetical protein|nr:MAG: hypothetical protein CVU51_07705 [Deltaproteobacteria bacterium HGW-Deltaproteobacteria-1]